MSLSVKIKKRFGNFLLDVDFASEYGVLGLLGASGCGKSMTLRSIAGIIKPDKGRIVLNGRTLFDSDKKIDIASQKRHVGYLFQSYALFPNMTVVQNVACGVKNDRNGEKTAEMIEKMRLCGLERLKPYQLSGGQQQRVALARILVGEPEALLLDEPFSALDSYLKEQLLTELRNLLASYKKDTILVTHSRDEAYELCGNLAIMDRGRIMGTGTTKDVFDDPGTRSGAVLTGCKNIVDAKKAGDTLVEVPSWGVVFDAGRKVGDGLCAIGIRAHFFGPDIDENANAISICEEIEEPFEWIMKFKFDGQAEDSPPVWWRLSKTSRPEADPKRLGVLPKNILLLYA